MNAYTLFADNDAGQYVTNGHTIVRVSNSFDTQHESLASIVSMVNTTAAFADLITNASADNVSPHAWTFGPTTGNALDDCNYHIIDTYYVDDEGDKTASRYLIRSEEW